MAKLGLMPENPKKKMCNMKNYAAAKQLGFKP